MNTTTLWLILLIPFAVLAIAVVYVVRFRERLQKLGDEQAPQWEQVARQFGLAYERPSPAAGYVHGTWQGHKLVATVIKRGRGGGASLVTQVAAFHKTPLDLGLHIVPQSWPRAGKRLKTGDEAFDEAFDFTARDPRVTGAIIDAGVRGAIQEVQQAGGLRSVNDANVLVEFDRYGVDGETLAKTLRLVATVCLELDRALPRLGSPPDTATGPFR